VADRGLAAVLLGHTLDDQAETVLLGLARGAGARALAGMAPARGPYRRPLLAVDRATTRRACDEAGLSAWEDPHNLDPAYARVRVRARVLPVLEEALGPGVAAALARTAAQLREDADALDALTPLTDDVAALAALPAALRTRALKRWAEGACGAPVTSAHVDALRALVDDWHGQGSVALPGGVLVRRAGGRLASLP
jgi:tRNA(Ile)-lysidine synthase